MPRLLPDGTFEYTAEDYAGLAETLGVNLFAPLSDIKKNSRRLSLLNEAADALAEVAERRERQSIQVGAHRRDTYKPYQPSIRLAEQAIAFCQQEHSTVTMPRLLPDGTFEYTAEDYAGFAETLGVNPFAPLADIKKKYRQLSLKGHPDKGGSHETMQQLNEAADGLTKVAEHREREFIKGAKKIWGFSLWQGRLLKKKEQEQREQYNQYEEMMEARREARREAQREIDRKLEELKKKKEESDKKKEGCDKGTKESQDESVCAANTTDSASPKSSQTHPTATASRTHDQDSTDSFTTHSTHPACADEDSIELPAGVEIAVGLVAEQGPAAHGQ
ncbi:unnamed protein product [Vitrella brassicaformis CCMP3155]|uniref:J domain-containing protein n=1 Tax=Vitrella brassicaformis (strain CCMP3155) TaxID=1169540 RepID=A0A0G4GVR5_VITBC|nr:unnamed protein product [Vitrella brassicaformis CCMP3155]|eukprot:CEM35043.1 unnamed protein product [Vitrella brassicaformis CCMP3155]